MIVGPTFFSGELSGAPAGWNGWPTIADDNLTANYEGDAGDAAGWEAETGSGSSTFTQSGSRIRLTGNARSTRRVITTPTTGNDWLFYGRFYADNGAGKYSSFILGDGTTADFEIVFGYNYPSGVAQAGTISTYNYITAASDVIVTGFDYSQGVDIAIHVDVDRSGFSIYYRAAGATKWLFGGAYPLAAGLSSFSAMFLVCGGASATTYIEYDWLLFCRPNIVAIGDSITAGHPLFNPNPAHFAGEDNGASTWMQHAGLYTSLRNNLIVNKGVGSQSSAQIFARVSEVNQTAVRLMLLHASSNDEALGVSQSARTTNIQNTVNAVADATHKVIVLNASYGTAAGSDNQPTPDLRDYMQTWWNTHRPTLNNVHGVIDIMQPVLSGGFLDATEAADGIHPNVAGYTAIGEYIEALP